MEISRFPFNGRQLHDDNLPEKPKAAEMMIVFLVSPPSLLQKLLNEGSSLLDMDKLGPRDNFGVRSERPRPVRIRPGTVRYTRAC